MTQTHTQNPNHTRPRTQSQTHTQTQTQVHTRTKLLENLRKMMDVSDFKFMMVYLNSIVRDIHSNYRATVNPFIEVVSAWMTDDEKEYNGEKIHVISVNFLLANKIMIIYKFASDKNDRIFDAGVYYRALCNNSHHPI